MLKNKKINLYLGLSLCTFQAHLTVVDLTDGVFRLRGPIVHAAVYTLG